MITNSIGFYLQFNDITFNDIIYITMILGVLIIGYSLLSGTLSVTFGKESLGFTELNLLPNGKISDYSKLKAFADDKVSVTQKLNFVMG